MRKTTRITMMLLFINLSAAAIDGSGLAADWGVDPNPGMDQAVEDLQTAMGNIDPSNLGSTLFGLYTSVTSSLEIVFNFIIYGPVMFNNLGVPGWATAVLFAPAYLFAGTDIAYLLTGRDV